MITRQTIESEIITTQSEVSDLRARLAAKEPYLNALQALLSALPDETHAEEAEEAPTVQPEPVNSSVLPAGFDNDGPEWLARPRLEGGRGTTPGSLPDRILAILISDTGRSWSPLEISLKLKERMEDVRWSLRDMWTRGVVRRRKLNRNVRYRSLSSVA